MTEDKEKEITTEEHYNEACKRQNLRIKDLDEENEILKQTLIKKEERMVELEKKLQNFTKSQ